MTTTIFGPDPIALEGRSGDRYWIRDAFTFCGAQHVDERLSEFPVAFFRPDRRPEETPLVIGLQGMCAPYTWNGFLVPTLLDMGIAVALIETPFAGERSLIRTRGGDLVSEISPLLDHDVRIAPVLLERIMEATTRDIRSVIDLLRTRHGMTDPRQALFGVSLGTLLTSYAFAREGIGQRLLGTIGHADLFSFARSYTPLFAPLILALPGRVVRRLGRMMFGRTLAAGREFLSLLKELSRGGCHLTSINPLTYSNQVLADRHVRFLVGANDPLVRIEDAQACAASFANGECYVVPGLGHGATTNGTSFVEHVRTYVRTQLGDWSA